MTNRTARPQDGSPKASPIRHALTLLAMHAEILAMIAGLLVTLPFVLMMPRDARWTYRQNLKAWDAGFCARWKALTGKDLDR
jgi:hypothetical protein